MSADVVLIPLNKNRFALVDAADLALVSEFRWCVTGRPGNEYAQAKSSGKTVMMHRLILDAPPGVQVDHLNRDTFDNRRANLRFCTDSQNHANTKLPSTNTTGLRGIYLTKHGTWRAKIQCLGRTIHLGSHRDQFQAARAYDRKARELFGEFARVNFPDVGEQHV